MTDSSTHFRNPFAGYYDLLYSDEDYGKECDLLQAVFSKCGVNPFRILDDAGGPRGPGAKRAAHGYNIVVVDRADRRALGTIAGDVPCAVETRRRLG